MNFKLRSFSQTLWRLNLINIKFHVDLLADEAISMMGLNSNGK